VEVSWPAAGRRLKKTVSGVRPGSSATAVITVQIER
jgi:hypothetical protein